MFADIFFYVREAALAARTGISPDRMAKTASLSETIFITEIHRIGRVIGMKPHKLGQFLQNQIQNQRSTENDATSKV